MDGISCDICDKSLLIDEDVRYVADIRVYAAYDPLELTQADLARDRTREIQRLIEQIEAMSEERLQDGVYRRFTFDLCPACQRKYLQDPLGKSRGTEE